MSFTCMPKPVCSQSWDSSTAHKQLWASNDMQTLSTGDFFTEQRKCLWYNTHCLQVAGYHSLWDAVNLWKTITEGKFYGNYVHTQSWLLSNQIYSTASNSWKINSLSENSQKFFLCWENGSFWLTQSFHFETFNNNQDVLCFSRQRSLNRGWQEVFF